MGCWLPTAKPDAKTPCRVEFVQPRQHQICVQTPRNLRRVAEPAHQLARICQCNGYVSWRATPAFGWNCDTVKQDIEASVAVEPMGAGARQPNLSSCRLAISRL